MKEEHSGSHESLGPANKEPHVKCLPGTEPAAMVDVREMAFVFEEVDGFSFSWYPLQRKHTTC